VTSVSYFFAYRFFVGLYRGVFWYVFHTTEGVKKEPVYLQCEGGLTDLLARLKGSLGSQEGQGD